MCLLPILKLFISIIEFILLICCILLICFFVPNLSFNLISISKLSSSLKCKLIFSFHECMIHDNITRDKIDFVELVIGLYIFNNSSNNMSLPSWIVLIRTLVFGIIGWDTWCNPSLHCYEYFLFCILGCEIWWDWVAQMSERNCELLVYEEW